MSTDQYHAPLATSEVVTPAVPAAKAETTVASGPWLGRWLAVLRVATGFIFLWAFVDKLFGLGYSTAGAKSWLNGGFPTKGFLSHVEAGPFQSMFRSWAGAAWADYGFMAGMLLIGLAVILGVGLKISAISGTVIMLGMWAAEWPLARFTSTGDPTASTNPFVDYHLIYALSLIVCALAFAGNTWGFGKKWAALPIVRKYSWLR